MKDLLEYRESKYFNSNDYYLIYTNMGFYYLTQVHFYNGFWFSDVSLNYKMTSVLSLNFNEINNKEVEYLGTTLKGKITKSITNNIGVVWYQGQDYRKYGHPAFWNHPRNLNIL